MLSPPTHYQRILLKLSGEALNTDSAGTSSNPSIEKGPLNLSIVTRIAQEIATLVAHNVQVGIVIGGGNWFRGVSGSALGLERITADQVGMLATVMNALMLRDLLTQQGLAVSMMSAIPIGHLIEPFERVRAKQYLQEGKVMLFAGGTGHPFVTTDAAASLRALEIEADILLKATSVDGIYSEDPYQNPKAIRYTHLTYQEVLQKELKVMDLAAFIQCRDHNLPIRVFNIYCPNNLTHILQGEPIGTLVN
jgi:uridylate kinase